MAAKGAGTMDFDAAENPSTETETAARVAKAAEMLEGLKQRLRAASGPIIELNADIEAWLLQTGRSWYAPYDTTPNFTGSEDAAKDLGNRIFPGAMWRVYDDEDGAVCAEVIASDMGYHKQKGTTWPLAIVLASLEGVS